MYVLCIIVEVQRQSARPSVTTLGLNIIVIWTFGLILEDNPTLGSRTYIIIIENTTYGDLDAIISPTPVTVNIWCIFFLRPKESTVHNASVRPDIEKPMTFQDAICRESSHRSV